MIIIDVYSMSRLASLAWWIVFLIRSSPSQFIIRLSLSNQLFLRFLYFFTFKSFHFLVILLLTMWLFFCTARGLFLFFGIIGRFVGLHLTTAGPLRIFTFLVTAVVLVLVRFSVYLHLNLTTKVKTCLDIPSFKAQCVSILGCKSLALRLMVFLTWWFWFCILILSIFVISPLHSLLFLLLESVEIRHQSGTAAPLLIRFRFEVRIVIRLQPHLA